MLNFQNLEFSCDLTETSKALDHNYKLKITNKHNLLMQITAKHTLVQVRTSAVVLRKLFPNPLQVREALGLG
jgi:hypothetical protein